LTSTASGGLKQGHQFSSAGFDRLIDPVETIRKATMLPISFSPGVIPENVPGRLSDTEASWDACYQETLTAVCLIRSGPTRIMIFDWKES